MLLAAEERCTRLRSTIGRLRNAPRLVEEDGEGWGLSICLVRGRRSVE